MLTYQLQDRVLRVDAGADLVFPGDVEIEMKLAPPHQFGAGGGHSRALQQGTTAAARFDPNTGHITSEPHEPLAPVNVHIEYSNLIFTVRGDVVSVKTRVETLSRLRELLGSLLIGVPTLLNVDFVDPIYVLHMKGVLGGVPFRWELVRGELDVDITTTRHQEERIVAMFHRMQMCAGTKNRQLLAALHYFHKACRLLVAGASRWEFMAEAILNFAKVLQSLFGDRRDDVRAKLRELGYSVEDIEKLFIPAMVLRDHIDVGHVMISILNREDLQAIYAYLPGAERAFRVLLKRVLDRVKAGELTFDEITELAPDAEQRRVVRRIVAAWGGPRPEAR